MDGPAVSGRQTVILLGKGDLAIKIAEWFAASPSYELVAVVPSMPPPGWSGSLPEWARSRGIPAVESGRYEDLSELSNPAWHPDLAFSVFYSRIIKASFIGRCRRILNLHNGPLPRYRGVSPINWALKNGETSHGVTIHEITPGIDDGPIVSQAKTSIFPEIDDVVDVYQRCLDIGWQLFLHTMPLLDRLVAYPQDESRALYYSRSDNSKLGDRRYFTRAESNAKLRGHQ
jgi:methionyl-tRNA formyltransferase